MRFAPAGNGDFNGDGNVDGADYTVWRKSLGMTGLVAYAGADGDGDGNMTKTITKFGEHISEKRCWRPEPTAARETRRLRRLSSHRWMNQELRNHLSAHRLVSETRPQSHLVRVVHRKLRVARKHSVFRPSCLVTLRPLSASRTQSERLTKCGTSRRDETLLSRLASQPDSKNQLDDFNSTKTRASEDGSDGDDFYRDSVEQVFALIASC